MTNNTKKIAPLINRICDDCDRYYDRDDAIMTGHRWENDFGILIGCEGFNHRNR